MAAAKRDQCTHNITSQGRIFAYIPACASRHANTKPQNKNIPWYPMVTAQSTTRIGFLIVPQEQRQLFQRGKPIACCRPLTAFGTPKVPLSSVDFKPMWKAVSYDYCGFLWPNNLFLLSTPLAWPYPCIMSTQSFVPFDQMLLHGVLTPICRSSTGGSRRFSGRAPLRLSHWGSSRSNRSWRRLRLSHWSCGEGNRDYWPNSVFSRWCCCWRLLILIVAVFTVVVAVIWFCITASLRLHRSWQSISCLLSLRLRRWRWRRTATSWRLFRGVSSLHRHLAVPSGWWVVSAGRHRRIRISPGHWCFSARPWGWSWCSWSWRPSPWILFDFLVVDLPPIRHPIRHPVRHAVRHAVKHPVRSVTSRMLFGWKRTFLEANRRAWRSASWGFTTLTGLVLGVAWAPIVIVALPAIVPPTSAAAFPRTPLRNKERNMDSAILGTFSVCASVFVWAFTNVWVIFGHEILKEARLISKIVMLYSQPKRARELGGQMFQRRLRKCCHAFFGEVVVAQMQLLQQGALFEDARQLKAAFIIYAISVELQDPQFMTLFTKLHHLTQTKCCHLGLWEVQLHKVAITLVDYLGWASIQPIPTKSARYCPMHSNKISDSVKLSGHHLVCCLSMPAPGNANNFPSCASCISWAEMVSLLILWYKPYVGSNRIERWTHCAIA